MIIFDMKLLYMDDHNWHVWLYTYFTWKQIIEYDYHIKGFDSETDMRQDFTLLYRNLHRSYICECITSIFISTNHLVYMLMNAIKIWHRCHHNELTPFIIWRHHLQIIIPVLFIQFMHIYLYNSNIYAIHACVFIMYLYSFITEYAMYAYMYLFNIYYITVLFLQRLSWQHRTIS